MIHKCVTERGVKTEEMLIFKNTLYINNTDIIVMYFLNINMHSDDLKEEDLVYMVQSSYFPCLKTLKNS